MFDDGPWDDDYYYWDFYPSYEDEYDNGYDGEYLAPQETDDERYDDDEEEYDYGDFPDGDW